MPADDALVARIARGELRGAQALPSVRAFALTLRVNPNTVQRAYRELEAMGVVESHPGQGTFVRADPDLVGAVRERTATAIVARAMAELTALGLDAEAIEQRFRQAHDGARFPYAAKWHIEIN